MSDTDDENYTEVNTAEMILTIINNVIFCKQSFRENASDGPSTPKKKRQIRHELFKNEKNAHRKQKYRPIWENNTDFKGWLKQDDSDCYRAKCSKCQVSFISELASIKNHAKSSTHKNAVKNTPLGSQAFMKSFVNRKDDPIDEQVKVAEIKPSGFLAEHNNFSN